MMPLEWLSTAMMLALAALCWRRDIRWVAFFMLGYPVLYFLPSIGVLFDGSGMSEIKGLHYLGSSFAVKAQGLFAIGFAGLALLFCTGSVSLRPWHGAVALLGGGLGVGVLLEVGVGGHLQLVNVLSLALMFGFASLGADAWEHCPAVAWRDGVWLLLAVLLLALLAASVGLAWWEIANDKAWARFTASSGHEIQRASAMMFNPNLYAMWCSVLGIILALLWQARVLSGCDDWLLSGVALAGLGIFLSSSRSLGYLLLVFLMSTAALLPHEQRRRWAPLLVYLLALLAASAVSMVAWRLGESGGSVGRFGVLAVRLLDAPMQLVALIITWLFPDSPVFSALSIPPETVLAFEGRFQGEGRDSGWLTAFDDAGLLGVLALAVFWGGLATFGLRALLFRKDIYTVYALCIVGYGIALGVFMRYQVFPVWMFLAVILAPCLALWRTILPKAALGSRVWL